MKSPGICCIQSQDIRCGTRKDYRHLNEIRNTLGGYAVPPQGRTPMRFYRLLGSFLSSWLCSGSWRWADRHRNAPKGNMPRRQAAACVCFSVASVQLMTWRLVGESLRNDSAISQTVAVWRSALVAISAWAKQLEAVVCMVHEGSFLHHGM